MRIVFLVSSLGAGGAERVAVTLCNAWSARGDQVVLMPTFSGRGECFYHLSSTVRLVYLADLVTVHKPSIVNKFIRIRMLRKFLVEENPDVIVSFLTNVNVAVIVAATGLDIPVVVSERSDPFIFPVSFLYDLARRITYPFANVLVVQTHAVASKYIEAKSNLRQLSVIANPIPQSILDSQFIAKKGTKRRLLAIGRFDEGKQFGMLINIYSRIANQFPDWSLRIVGDGPMRLTLQQQVFNLGIDGLVELPGRTDAIAEELACADVFVMTSKFEGFPNVLLEAMAAGLPCAAFDCPSGPREMCGDGQTAFLIPLNDEQAMAQALERLMLDEELRLSLGSRARSSVIARFALDKILGHWDLLFKTVEKV
jgi:GalNAc-alpha-(1->4)-GalNAc-alpha-(1->3)-diNAcBac-PP-undecaprenol alpha-1,4-N-acetyl-D-galactosaminyltransferase